MTFKPRPFRYEFTMGSTMNERTDAERAARLDRMIADSKAHNLRLTKERHEREGTCGCGFKVAQCSPERCSHEFARDALWGSS